MNVREFKLVNEKGQEYSLMDIENYCLLTNPTGLGINYENEYEILGNTFIQVFSKMGQGQISADINTLKYDNLKKLADFIAFSEKIKISYKIPFETGSREYFKDVKLQLLEKTEKKPTGVITEAISFDCLTLWYEETNVIYEIKGQEKEIRWNFKWDSRFTNYNVRNLKFINKGHVEAPIKFEIDGNVVNPTIELYVNEELYQKVIIHTTIKQYEKLLYNSKENEFVIERKNTDGTIENLFDLDVIDFANDNVIRIPTNKSCEIRIKADNDIRKAKVIIYTFYKFV